MAFPTTYVNSKGATVPFPTPQRPIPEGIKTSVLINQFDSGHEQRRRKGAPRKTFEVTYPFLDQQAYAALQAFFLSVGGSLDTFSWVHPVTKVTYTVRFDLDALQGEYHMTTRLGHFWKCSLKLLQVL